MRGAEATGDPYQADPRKAPGQKPTPHTLKE
jgi:hypothetical protein